MLAKGGVRLTGPDAVDVFYDGETLEVLSAPKVGEAAVSGAGCSLAAAVTAELAKGATRWRPPGPQSHLSPPVSATVWLPARPSTRCGRAAPY